MTLCRFVDVYTFSTTLQTFDLRTFNLSGIHQNINRELTYDTHVFDPSPRS